MPVLFILLAIILVVINLAVLVASVWALAFGIIDIVNVGVNFWAIVWIIVGAIGILSSLGSSSRITR